METDYYETSVVTPEIDQSDTELIQDSRTKSVLIPEGNTVSPSVLTTLVDKTALGGGEPIDLPQGFVSPNIEELDTPQIKVEDVSNEDSDDELPIGDYVNIEGLRRSHKDRYQPT